MYRIWETKHFFKPPGDKRCGRIGVEKLQYCWGNHSIRKGDGIKWGVGILKFLKVFYQVFCLCLVIIPLGIRWGVIKYHFKPLHITKTQGFCQDLYRYNLFFIPVKITSVLQSYDIDLEDLKKSKWFLLKLSLPSS